MDTPAAPATQHLKYRPEVDGLRAIAVVPVILFHAGFDWFSGGFVGVDVFFVISGYLITTIILTEKAAGRFNLVSFYERRARRILPALFFVMAACLPFAWVWMTPDELNDFAKSVVAVTVFASNILFWKTSGYFDSATEEKPLLHTWSLGVEEQYYLLFPLLLMLTWRFGHRRQIALIGGVAVASLLLSEWGWRNNPDANFYLAPTRAWELMIGSALAFISHKVPLHQRVSQRGSDALSLLGLVGILAAIFIYDENTPFPSVYALLPTLGTALVLGFASSASTVGRLLSLRLVVFVGLLSYSAYLWHQPLFAFARIYSAEHPSPLAFMALALASLILAYLTWRFVESPFRNRRRIPRRPIFVLSISGSAMLMVLGLGGTLSGGFPSRLDASHRALLATASPSPKRDACHTQGEDFTPPAQACTYFGNEVTWAVFGDSHAVEPAYALAEQLAHAGQGLLHLSFSRCRPSILYVNSVPGCSRWQNKALEYLEGAPHITNVLVAFRYSAALFGDHLDNFPEIPDSKPRINNLGPDESRALIWQSFTTIVERLQQSGKRVFVLGPIPELGRPVQQNIIAAQFKRDPNFDRGTSRAYFEQRNRYVLDRLSALPWGNTLIQIAPADVLCNDHDCRAVVDAQAMYFDDDHLSIAGARRVLNQLAPYLDGPHQQASSASALTHGPHSPHPGPAPGYRAARPHPPELNKSNP